MEPSLILNIYSVTEQTAEDIKKDGITPCILLDQQGLNLEATLIL